MYYLRKRDQNSYDGIESNINYRMGKDDLMWFPFGQSLSLMKMDDEKETLEKKCETICNTIVQFQEDLKENFNLTETKINL